MQTNTRDRIRDALLALTVGASLIGTGWAFYDPGATPPPPKVSTAPTSPVVHDPAY